MSRQSYADFSSGKRTGVSRPVDSFSIVIEIDYPKNGNLGIILNDQASEIGIEIIHIDKTNENIKHSQLNVGDVITEIDGWKTSHMKCDEIQKRIKQIHVENKKSPDNSLAYTYEKIRFKVKVGKKHRTLIQMKSRGEIWHDDETDEDKKLNNHNHQQEQQEDERISRREKISLGVDSNGEPYEADTGEKVGFEHLSRRKCKDTINSMHPRQILNGKKELISLSTSIDNAYMKSKKDKGKEYEGGTNNNKTDIDVGIALYFRFVKFILSFLFVLGNEYNIILYDSV